MKNHPKLTKIWPWCALSTAVIIVGVALTLVFTLGQSSPTPTTNPFSSSFETSDPVAEQNHVYMPSENMSYAGASVGNGPQANDGYNIKSYVGFTGTHSYTYSGMGNSSNKHTSFSYYIYENLNVIVGSNAEFSYKIFPEFGPAKSGTAPDLTYPSSFVSVDLLYNDNNTSDKLQSLINTNTCDQYGYGISPTEQGQSKSLYSGQWNSKKFDLHAIRYQHVHAMVLKYDFNIGDVAPPDVVGYLDDVSIEDTPIIDAHSLTNYVDVRRGTDSSGDFSRGNNLPAVATPNGFNFYTPMTDVNTNWLYRYKEQNDVNNLPTMQGFGISHEPSPWMGDRNQFNIMPQLSNSADDQINTKPADRALEFSHSDEIARPDYYSVNLKNGIRQEITPSSHSAIFRTTFPATSNYGSVIFDSKDGNAGTDYFAFKDPNDAPNSFRGWVDNGNASGRVGGRSIMFLYGEFSNQNFTIHTDTNYKNRQYITFSLDSSKTVNIKLASSFISINQAKKNLALEITNDNLNFETLQQRAANIWNTRLGAVNLSKSNATDTQKTTMYSNLYRLNLYPNEQFENTGTTAAPIYEHASPVLPKVPGPGPSSITTDTDAQVKPGKMYVNNGFWDTYRTVWPAYQLLYPNFVKELIDGFLLQYIEGGWVARWSSPGYCDAMTGTSSDCAFADAYTSGVITDIDTALNIYKSGLKDATQYSSDDVVGRKELKTSLFLGYTSTAIGESASWSLEGYINDYAIGEMAIKLSQDTNLSDQKAIQETNQTKQQICDTGNYLKTRAENYSLLFDSATKFFRGKTADGTFANQGGGQFNPLNWGYEFTETNGWNFAFTAPFDVPGLIGLYGGQAQFKNKLDDFFNTPETGTHPGSYGGTIHEMREARDVRLGQLGMSNQPSHHIPYMYAAAGYPSRTQELTREILQRLYAGADIGQGYCGDEDNGEMSAWGILSSLGLYNLALGSSQYIVTSPLFSHALIQRDNGAKIDITASNNQLNNKYISSASLDEKSFNDVYIRQSDLLKGNHTLSYTMSPTPTSWGSKTINGTTPQGITDVIDDGELTVDGSAYANLTDKDVSDSQTFTDLSNITLNWERTTANNSLINMFALTSGVSPIVFTSFKFSGSMDGTNWDELTTLHDQIFNLSFETKQYSFLANKNYDHYKLELSSSASSISLAEFALLSGYTA